MLLLIVSLAILAFWSPRWSTFGLLAFLVAIVQAGVLAWTMGLFAPGVDLASARSGDALLAWLRALALNLLIFLALGAVVVIVMKRLRQRDAEELDLLARLVNKPPPDPPPA